jgi:endo-1,4-beta-xylanase
MRRLSRRSCQLPIAANLLLGVALVACGASPDASTTPNGSGEIPVLPGELPGETPAEAPAEEMEEPDDTPVAAEPPRASEEPIADIPLQPSAEAPETEGDPPPATPEPEVPIVSGPPPKFVGNITTGNSVDTNGLIYSDYWDQITPENAGKWGSVQATAASAPNYAALDAIYDYTQRKGIIFKEHAFVWGSQQPSGDITETDVRSWMQGFCTRYPNTRLIDVVNEPPPHTEPRYANAIGGGTNGDWRWIANVFKWAREACPNATLILNDYNNIEFANQTQHFIDIVKAIQAQGAPIDALGAQSHGLNGANSTRTMIPLLTKLHDDTGLPVYITEYDINQADDATQLARFQEHFAFFLDTEWVRGVTVWGWILGRTWVANSGVVRNGAPRPAMTWLMQELGRPVPP